MSYISTVEFEIQKIMEADFDELRKIKKRLMKELSMMENDVAERRKSGIDYAMWFEDWEAIYEDKVELLTACLNRLSRFMTWGWEELKKKEEFGEE